ncbi:MAG TPA: hypothetical protein VIQ24_17090 [Pyrinomonadaceae bacterium]
MKFICTAILLIGASVLALAQEAQRPVAAPSRRLVTRGELHHPLSEIHLDIEASAGKPEDVVAMRICSNEPLPVALFISVVNPAGIGQSFVEGSITGRLFFAPERVLILRSADCPVTHPPYVPVEFWGVPKGAALPPSVESLKLCQVKFEEVGAGETVKSSRTYRAALKSLAVKLSANPELVGVILGEYNLRPSGSLKRALKESERFLEGAGVSRQRFFLRLKPSTYYDPEYTETEPKFPDIFAVQITQVCND